LVFEVNALLNIIDHALLLIDGPRISTDGQNEPKGGSALRLVLIDLSFG
jgi:hypothetical protein